MQSYFENDKFSQAFIIFNMFVLNDEIKNRSPIRPIKNYPFSNKNHTTNV